MIKRLYPDGKQKAFNITYDDGIEQDIRFVSLLNKYNIKGTFNLNSQLMKDEFRWVHETGMVVKRLPVDKVIDLYKNHEVASHTLTHPYMHDMGKDEVMYLLSEDKKNLERIFNQKISGFAVPFSYYSSLIADCAKECGFEYARCSEERYTYIPPEDYYWWAAGAFHLNPQWRSFAEGFFSTDTELALCQIVGHSYDLDVENMWDEMEDFISRIAEDDSIASMTNIELVRYLKAIKNATITDNYIENNSDITLWFSIKGQTICISANEKYYF